MTSRQAMEEYNDGTIYRIHVKRGLSLLSNVISVPVDIAQSELVGKVLIGVESMCLDRELYYNPLSTEIAYPPYANEYTNLRELDEQLTLMADNWCDVQYLQFRSVSLPPDIDFTTQEAYNYTEITRQNPSGQPIDPPIETDFSVPADGRNSQIFARMALPLDLIVGNNSDVAFLNPRVAVNNNLGKNGILTEMTNNPNAISNGLLHIQLIDNNGDPWNLNKYPIRNLQFVLVIYKPRNTYN